MIDDAPIILGDFDIREAIKRKKHNQERTEIHKRRKRTQKKTSSRCYCI